MAIPSRNSAFSRVTALAGLRPVHAAFAWLHGNPQKVMDWQVELVSIPAPLNGEQARAEWLRQQFIACGLSAVEIDGIGNVRGILPARLLPPESTGPVILLSAHLDTVFPLEAPLHPVLDGDRLASPGACDNGAGAAGLLAIAHAIRHAQIELPVPLVFLGNVGEEGEGDLRGMRFLYSQTALGQRVAAHIVLDGAGADGAVTQGVGSRRFQVTICGPGGHSFTDAGTPNPIAAMASALAAIAETPLPDEPRTTMNLGTIRGGTSVNSIPENVQATVDFRSTSAEQLLRLEAALEGAVQHAVTSCNLNARNAGNSNKGPLAFSLVKIGDRPAAGLPDDSPLLEALRAVDRHLGLRTDPRLGSTDANLPLSLGVPALSMGAGGEGGGAHTLAEWYSARDRELGLRRVLLLTLAMLEWAAEQ
jgi:tripeptide aminopeptidase